LKLPRGEKIPGPEIVFQGWKFRPRAGISAPRQNFRGPEIHGILGNFKPFYSSPLSPFSSPSAFEIRLSPLRNVVVQRAVRGPEILVSQNFWGPEIYEISGPRKFG
jgi:hypothetical protein